MTVCGLVVRHGLSMVIQSFIGKQKMSVTSICTKVTDVYLKNLPEDYIPYWDFNDPSIPDAPRDASAACVVASALLELSGYLPAEKALEYKQAAVKMLTSLSSDKYQCGESKPAFLLHSTGHLPAESEIDASIIYADYYYMEALLRLKRLTENKTGH